MQIQRIRQVSELGKDLLLKTFQKLERIGINSNSIYEKFWQTLSALTEEQDSNLCKNYNKTNVCPLDDYNENDLLNLSYKLLCQIDNNKIYVKEENNTLYLAILENNKKWDLSEWGEDSQLKTRLLSEVFFMTINDDLQIDNDEKNILLCIITFFKISIKEIKDAKFIIYWNLIQNIIEDGVITNEEQEIVKKVTNVLEINKIEKKNLDVKAFDNYITQFIQKSNTSSKNKKLPRNLLDKISNLGKKLSIDPSYINQKISELKNI